MPAFGGAIWGIFTTVSRCAKTALKRVRAERPRERLPMKMPMSMIRRLITRHNVVRRSLYSLVRSPI
jgi:hypothetical protein